MAASAPPVPPANAASAAASPVARSAPSPLPPAIVVADRVTRVYRAAEDVVALRGISLTIRAGEFVAIVGASGSGKSTLMHILGCLDRPTSGSYRIDGVETSGLDRDELAAVRRRRLGFVFQGFNLLPRATALENVELPLAYERSVAPREARERARVSLAGVGLAHREEHLPSQLSGGQQQRVAIARALVNRPALLLADEPTGNLDSRTSFEVLALFQELNDSGVTLVLVTHEADVARCARRVVELADGRVVRDERIADRLLARERLEETS